MVRLQLLYYITSVMYYSLILFIFIFMKKILGFLLGLICIMLAPSVSYASDGLTIQKVKNDKSVVDSVLSQDIAVIELDTVKHTVNSLDSEPYNANKASWIKSNAVIVEYTSNFQTRNYRKTKFVTVRSSINTLVNAYSNSNSLYSSNAPCTTRMLIQA